MAFVHEARETLSRRNYQHRLNPVVAVRLAAADHLADEATTMACISAARNPANIFRDGG